MVGTGVGGVVSESTSFDVLSTVKFGSLLMVQIVPANGVAEPAGVTVNDFTVKLVPAAEVKLTGELVCVAKLKLG